MGDNSKFVGVEKVPKLHHTEADIVTIKLKFVPCIHNNYYQHTRTPHVCCSCTKSPGWDDVDDKSKSAGKSLSKINVLV